MLWYKSWLETRWRFVIGLVVLVCAAAVVVLTYPDVLRRLPLAASQVESMDGVIGEQMREGVALAGEYRGYVWWQWFRQNLPQTWTVFAALLGAGGLLAQTSGGAALFTLSLPVSRHRILGARAAIGLVELLALAVVPAAVISLLSPAIGQSYSVVDALVHGLCLFGAGTVFFSLSFLLSTVFTDVWRPALIAIVVALLLALAEQAVPTLSRNGLFQVMTARDYFRAGEVPWAGLLGSTAVSAAMLYAATVSIARRDF